MNPVSQAGETEVPGDHRFAACSASAESCMNKAHALKTCCPCTIRQLTIGPPSPDGEALPQQAQTHSKESAGAGAFWHSLATLQLYEAKFLGLPVGIVVESMGIILEIWEL